MKKFDKIGQFRDVVKCIKKETDFVGIDSEGNASFEHVNSYPTLRFHGTVKLHGTNAGITRVGDKLIPQSRSRIISIESDNAGFAAYVSRLPVELFPENVTIFGEWAGQGIQKGVGICEIPKSFFVFDYQSMKHGDLSEYNIYFMSDFESYDVAIDFENPQIVIELLANITESVEKECPVAKSFGISGIGEGVVWTYSDYKFKVKGEKHQSSKVKTLVSISPEKVKSVKDFVSYVLTESRLSQGIDYLKEMDFEVSRKSTGEYLKWINKDVISEEKDTFAESNLEWKELAGELNSVARLWFLKSLIHFE